MKNNQRLRTSNVQVYYMLYVWCKNKTRQKSSPILIVILRSSWFIQRWDNKSAMERRNLTFIDCRACRVEHYRHVAVVPTQRDLVELVQCYTSRMDNGDKRIQSNPERRERGTRSAGERKKTKCHRKSRRLSLKESQEKHASGTRRESEKKKATSGCLPCSLGWGVAIKSRQRNNCPSEIWSKSPGHWGNEMLKEDFWNNNSDSSRVSDRKRKEKNDFSILSVHSF